MNIEKHLANKINEYEKKLVYIEGCIAKQRNMQIDFERNLNIVHTLDKTMMAYKLCLSELNDLKEKCNEK
jgi:hypothetical protein